MNITMWTYVSHRPASVSVLGRLRACTVSAVCAVIGVKQDSAGGTTLPSCRDLSWSALV